VRSRSRAIWLAATAYERAIIAFSFVTGDVVTVEKIGHRDGFYED
jgi:hypothetical protein